jgi:hypothetical protein
MTTNSPDRLDRIEALVESNARAIQALGEDLATTRLIQAEYAERAEAERAELRRATVGIANLLSSLDSDRPTILRKLNTIETKVDQLLQGGAPRDEHPA